MEQVICVPMNDSYLASVVQVHIESFPGYFTARMGEPFLRAYYGWFAHSRQALTYVALDSKSEVLGFVVGATNRHTYFNDMIAEAWPRLIGGLLNSVIIQPSVAILLVGRSNLAIAAFRGMMSKLFSLCRRAGRNTVTVTNADGRAPDRVASLVSIAVRASSRRMGVASGLEEAFIKEARSRGCSGISLTVRPDNKGAIRFYEHAGWSLVRRKAEDALSYYKQL